jgi:hypothetical protein
MWVAGVLALVLASLGAAVMLAVFRDGTSQAFWVGFGVIGGLYLLLLAYGWSLDAHSSGSNPLSPNNVITGRLAELSYNWLFSVRPTQTRMNFKFATQQSMAGANRVLTFTTSTQPQPSGVYTFVATAASVPSGPSSQDFVNVAHGFWALLLAACGGWFAQWLYVTKRERSSQ